MTDSREPLVYKAAELAEILGLGENRVYDMIRTGRIPAIKWGDRSICVPRQALEQFLVDEAFRQQQERLRPSERNAIVAEIRQRRRRASGGSTA